MKKYTVIIDNYGTTRWYKVGTNILHREDGPAIEYADGGNAWYINGKLHREDGSAIDHAGGYKSWYINGLKYTEEQFNNRNKVELTMDEIAIKFNIPINQLKIKKD